MIENPLVSIIMPVYNSVKYIEEAISSIIDQTYDNWEFIIINEFGSNDGSFDIINKYSNLDERIKPIQNNKRLGISESLSEGIRLSKGKYIARMDADDISLPKRIEKQVEFLEENNDILLCGTKVAVIGPNKINWKIETNKDLIRSNILFYLPCLPQTIMFKKDFFLEHKFLFKNKNYTFSEYYDFFMKILHYGNISNIDEELVRFRLLSNLKNRNTDYLIYKDLMRNNFLDLKLNFSEDEIKLLSVHFSMKGAKYEEVLEKMILLDLLLKKIFVANSKVLIYDKYNLFKTLHARFKEAYDSISSSCKDYNHEKAKEIYNKSIFSNKSFYVQKDFLSNNPEISVLLPTYNSEKYIADTLWSIFNQTFTNYEIIILNEFGSEDNTLDFIQLFEDNRIRIIQNDKKLGLADSLNRGIDVSKGKYIARIDADDLAMPNRFQKQYDFLESNKDYSLCGSLQRHFGLNVDCIHRVALSHEDIKAYLIYNCELCHSTLMLRRDDFVSKNLYYDKTKFAEDYELWTRAIHNMKFANIPEVLGEYRIGNDNITQNKLELLLKESSEIVYKNITNYLKVDIPKSHIKYLSTWGNEFNSIRDKSEYDIQVEIEKKILSDMFDNNKIYRIYEDYSLLKAINRRWKFINNDWKYYEEMDSILPLNELFNYKTKESMYNKSKEIRHYSFIKKHLKNLVMFFYKPFKYRIIDKIRQQLWDLDGHLKDSTDSIRITVKDSEELLKDNLSIQINYLKNFVEEKLDSQKDYYVKQIDSRIWKAEENLSQQIDSRIWKAELYLKKEILRAIWNLDRKIYLNNIVNNNNDTSDVYNEYFYEDNQYCSYISGVEVLKKLLPILKSTSIVDFGCGTATWLFAAKKINKKLSVLGIDGEYVDRNFLLIDKEDFLPYDLTEYLNLEKKFDLAISMEVAEHLEEKYADIFVDNICRHSDIVLFSAAHVGQGGDGHINEQPVTYWIEKFAKRNYKCIDIRHLYENNFNIEEYYKENMLLYVKIDKFDSYYHNYNVFNSIN